MPRDNAAKAAGSLRSTICTTSRGGRPLSLGQKYEESGALGLTLSSKVASPIHCWLSRSHPAL